MHNNNGWFQLEQGGYLGAGKRKQSEQVRPRASPSASQRSQAADLAQQKTADRGLAPLHSQTIGAQGPVLLQDTVLHETLETFAFSTALQRVVHTKGYGAFGHFRTTHSMAEYTSAAFLQTPDQQVPVAVRFSLAASNQGTPDTSRNLRGFTTKFYTPGGIFDLICNNIPVFFVRDAMQVPDAVGHLAPSPVNNMADSERFWRLFAKYPEATNILIWLFSDLGTIKSFRHMRGNSVSTYVWKNAQGRRRYVKYNWLPLAGEKYIDRQEAEKLAGEDPDIAGRDLYGHIAAGKAVHYELCVQLMDPEDAKTLPYDPLDDTKVWDESRYPLLPVGQLVLDRNPDNYADQVEKLAFAPANLVPGIELSDDKMLQGRAFVYTDAQRHRLGPNFRSIPINQQQNWTPQSMVSSGNDRRIAGEIMRAEIPHPDNFTQAGQKYESFSAKEKESLADNIASSLAAALPNTQGTVLSHLEQASPALARAVTKRISLYVCAGEW